MKSPMSPRKRLFWTRTSGGLTRVSEETLPARAATDWKRYCRTAQLSGGRVHYLDIGHGPTVVFIHGLGLSWRVWLRNIGDLARDHRVIAVDLPGFGASQRLRWRRDLSGHADAVLELVQHIGARPCTLVGHSLGGMVAQRAALRLGTDLDKLVLVSSPDSRIGFWQRIGIVVSLSSLRTLLYSRRVQRWCIAWTWLHKPLFGGLVDGTNGIDSALMTELLSGYATNGFWRGMHAALRDPVSRHLGAIEAPTLVLTGVNDPLVRLASAYRLADSIPHATVVRWDRVGHGPMLERPAEFNALVRDFVGGPASSGLREQAN